jgi:RNA polymerase sigma factor (sigma-70 family)
MQYNQESELALWEAFVSGKREAYAGLYRIYHPRLYNYGRKFTVDNVLVEDCIQEIFIHFWTNRSKLSGKHISRSYLFVSFRRRLLKTLYQANKHSSAFISEEYFDFAVEASIDQVMINKECLYERHINLKKALENLTNRQKEALFCMFYENMSYDEIASIFHISKKATYKLIARALAELRAVYKQNAISCMLPLTIIIISHLLSFFQ